MRVTTTQVLDGIQRYIENDVLPKIPDARKWLVGAYVATVMMPYRQNPASLVNHPIMKPLMAGVDDGTIDIDNLHAALLSQARQGASFIEIPLVGPYHVDTSDVDRLYNYIIS